MLPTCKFLLQEFAMLQPLISAMPVRSTSERVGKGIDEMRTWFHVVSTKLSPLSAVNP